MDPIKNPFSPGAGSPPPELVGRENILDQAKLLLARVRAGRSEKSLFLTGLRGVGKTVLLNAIETLARESGCSTVLVEAHEDKSLGALLVPDLRRLLFGMNRGVGAQETVRRGLAVLRSFISTVKVKVENVEFGLDIEPERGAADSGDIENDLANLFQAIAEAAKERQTVVVILIDEIQYLKLAELSALIMAMHRMQQRQLPLVLIGAGLTVLPGLVGESKSYAERLFHFPNVGPLSSADAVKALQDPVLKSGVSFDQAALDEILAVTHGYPYFLQEWGYQAWNRAEGPGITADVVKEASPTVVSRLDQNFFRVRFDRMTPREKEYLRAMAHLGPGAHRSEDVAQALGVKLATLGPVRDRLIKKGMIYSPSHGDMAFTVPLFDEFMERAIPEFIPRGNA